MKRSHMYRAEPNDKNWYYENLIADLTPPRTHGQKVLLRYYQRLARRGSHTAIRAAEEA